MVFECYKISSDNIKLLFKFKKNLTKKLQQINQKNQVYQKIKTITILKKVVDII